MIKYYAFILLYLLSYSLFAQHAPVIPAEENELYRKIYQMTQSQSQLAQKELEKLPADCSPAFDLMLGNLLLRKKNFEKAEQSLLRAIKKFPEFYHAELNLSTLYLQQNNTKKALTHLLNLARMGKADGDIWKKISHCHLIENNFLAAQQALENARPFLPHDSQIEYAFLNIALQQQDFPQALKISRQLLRKNPQQKKLWHITIDCLQKLGKDQECLRHFELYSRMFPLDQKQHMQLAGLYFNFGLYHDALTQYSKIQLQNHQAFINRLLCLRELNLNQKIIETASNPPEKLSPSHSELLYQIKGQALLQLQKLPEALTALNQSLQFNALNSRTHYQIAEIYEIQKKYPLALKHFYSASRDNYTAAPAFMRRARIFLLLQQHKEALIAAENAVQADPSPATKKFFGQIQRITTPN